MNTILKGKLASFKINAKFHKQILHIHLLTLVTFKKYFEISDIDLRY